MARGKNSKKKQTKRTKGTKKKGGVYQMGGDTELGTYKATQKDDGAILVEPLPKRSGSGSAVVADVGELIPETVGDQGNMIFLAYNDKDDIKQGFRILSKAEEDELKEAVKGTGKAPGTAVGDGNSESHADLAALLKGTVNDKTNFGKESDKLTRYKLLKSKEFGNDKALKMVTFTMQMDGVTDGSEIKLIGIPIADNA